MRRTPFFLAVLGVSLVVLAGCGSDGSASDSTSTTDRTSTTASATSEAAFADQVNGICGDSTAAMGEIFGPVASMEGPPTAELLQSTYDALLTYLQGEHTALEALTPPADQKQEWDALVAAHADALAVVEEQGVAYFDDEETDTFAEVESMAVAMGFDACGGEDG